MVIFSIVFLFAFNSKSYLVPDGTVHTSPFYPVLHALNLSDFFLAGGRGIVFAWGFMLGRPGTRGGRGGAFDIDQAYFHGAKDDSRRSSQAEMTEVYITSRGQEQSGKDPSVASDAAEELHEPRSEYSGPRLAGRPVSGQSEPGVIAWGAAS